MPAGYYRVGQYYVDTNSNTLYRCITAGTKTTSAWKIVGAGSWQTPKRELDPTVAVAQYTWVYISPGNSLCSAGLVDLVSNALTKSRPGIWQALQAIPAKDGAGKYNVPQIPYPSNGGSVSGTPLAGDADAANNYWILISPVPYC